MKISFIIPTCNREQMFNETINSIYQNTTHKKRIEILVIADEHDLPTQAYVSRVIATKGHLFGDFKLLTRPRSDALNEDYYNWATRQSTGDLIWIYADDLINCAPDWDTTIDREVEAYASTRPDRIFCVSIKDNTPPPSHRLPKFPCFPMLTREAVNCLGWILHPKPKNWGVDYINYIIFSGADRMLCIHDRNYINHVSYHTHQVPSDATSIRIGQIFNSTKMIPHHNTDRILAEECPNLITHVKQAIADYKPKETTV